MDEKPDLCLLANAKYSESVRVLNPMKVNPTHWNRASKNHFESQRDIMGFTVQKIWGSDFYELFYHLPMRQTL